MHADVTSSPNANFYHYWKVVDGAIPRVDFHVDMKEDVTNRSDKTLSSYRGCASLTIATSCTYTNWSPVDGNWYYYEEYATINYGTYPPTTRTFDTRRWTTQYNGATQLEFPAYFAGG